MYLGLDVVMLETPGFLNRETSLIERTTRRKVLDDVFEIPCWLVLSGFIAHDEQ